MSKVIISTPNFFTVEYRQERGDQDYGTCMWAVFNFELDRYDMTIMSDCGNYSYGWTPTPKSESFLELLARMDWEYMLGKITTHMVIDEKATFAAVKKYLQECDEDTMDEESRLDDYAWDSIESAISESNNRDVVARLIRDQIEAYAVGDTVTEWDIYQEIETTEPAAAKKIAQVFRDYIQPKVREYTKKEAEK